LTDPAPPGPRPRPPGPAPGLPPPPLGAERAVTAALSVRAAVTARSPGRSGTYRAFGALGPAVALRTAGRRSPAHVCAERAVTAVPGARAAVTARSTGGNGSYCAFDRRKRQLLRVRLLRDRLDPLQTAVPAAAD